MQHNDDGRHHKRNGISGEGPRLNYVERAVGVLSPSVVETALALGTKQIDMPTYRPKAHLDAYGDDQKIFHYKTRAKPIFILDDRGRLIPEVEEIIELTKTTSSFIASGHLSTPEVDAMVTRAKEKGCRVLACGVSTDMPGYPLDARKKWVSEKIFMEYGYMTLTDVPHMRTPLTTIVEQIRAVGAEKCEGSPIDS